MSTSVASLSALALLNCLSIIAGLSMQLKVTSPADKPWLDRNADPDHRANLLLAEMTHEEKRKMLHGDCMSCPYVGHIPGNDRLGIPDLNLHDGPQGFRSVGGPPEGLFKSTSFPGGMAMAATWDDEALHDWGVAMGKEFKMKGGNVQLGPGLNLARVPLNGRNFEYTVGEDPYLGYRLSKPAVQGIQEQNVIATAKHWVVNSQETNRMDGTEDVDERTLFEMYYPPFEGAVDGGVGSVMCSYQKINGAFSCENAATLSGHLKKDLGFKGFVMSDWGATHSASIHQGLDMEMPIGDKTTQVGLALDSKFRTSQEDIDHAIFRILRTMFEIGTFDQPAGTWNPEKYAVNATTVESVKLARELGVKSTVLLKNDGDVLPLPVGKKIALIGFADLNAIALSFGHGSGEVPPSHFVSPLEGIRAAAGAGAEVVYDDGKDIGKAAAVAKAADYAIVFVGASASEGADRLSLSLDHSCATNEFGNMVPCDGPDAHQNSLIDVMVISNPKTIVVASIPGAVLMPWSPKVPAILTNFMPGQEVGHVLADILFGKESPVARLPITLPNGVNDMKLTAAQWPGKRDIFGTPHSQYSEKLLVGYRYYEEHNITFTTGFPFGHGLSYTSFDYSDLAVTKKSPNEFEVTFKVTNVGKTPGADIAQLYLSFPAAAGEPVSQLKGFQKTAKLRPGASETVTLSLPARALSIWNVEAHQWTPVAGSFGAHVGASSRDLRLSATFENL